MREVAACGRKEFHALPPTFFHWRHDRRHSLPHRPCCLYRFPPFPPEALSGRLVGKPCRRSLCPAGPRNGYPLRHSPAGDGKHTLRVYRRYSWCPFRNGYDIPERRSCIPVFLYGADRLEPGRDCINGNPFVNIRFLQCFCYTVKVQ